MIDTLLSQKYNEAQKKSIPVLFSLCDLSECPISSRDLLVLLGNLVDNAIEASEKMANPCIQIKLQRSDNDFVLSVRNRTTPGMVITNNVIPLSTKGGMGHGMGLYWNGSSSTALKCGVPTKASRKSKHTAIN